MHIPQQEQFAPADETEEEREQREQETYLHARFHKQERHYNDSYNPNRVKTQNFVYLAAADCEVDLARPTILPNTGIDSVSPPEPPKAKPDTGQFTFDMLKKRRKKRQADMSWIKNKILTQQDHVRKLEFVEISPWHPQENYCYIVPYDLRLDELYIRPTKNVFHAPYPPYSPY